MEMYMLKNLTIKDIISESNNLTEEEIEYASKRIIFKIEDLKDKEKAIFDTLQLLGELSVDDSFDETDDTKKKIEKIQSILMYIQS